MSRITVKRLIKELKDWRQAPLYRFKASPSRNKNGTMNLMVWNCVIPGMQGTLWQKGRYHLKMIFKDDYPMSPPVCQFVPTLFHPNVYPSGVVFSTKLIYGLCWKASTTIKRILLYLQRLLVQPIVCESAQFAAYTLYCDQPLEYDKRVKAQARKFRTRFSLE